MRPINCLKSEADTGLLPHSLLCTIFHIADRELLEGRYCCKSFLKEAEETNFKGISIPNSLSISEFLCYFSPVRTSEKNFPALMSFVLLPFFPEEYEDDVPRSIL